MNGLLYTYNGTGNLRLTAVCIKGYNKMVIRTKSDKIDPAQEGYAGHGGPMLPEW